MKKQILMKAGLLLLLVTSVGIANGQDANRHKLQIGLGSPIVLTNHPHDYNNNYDYAPYPHGMGYFSDYYQGDKIAIPNVNLSYSYQFKSWLAFGATLGYAGVFQKTYNLYNDAVYTKRSWHFIGLTPTVRFDWFRTNTVKLYSCLGLGLAYNFEQERYMESGHKTSSGFYIPTVDFTPIGISVGRKIFGFCELGVSSHGIAKMGIGYRFNDKSKR